jgi:hypothetical protein
VSAVVQKGLKDWIGSASGIDNRELEAYLRNKLRARVEEWGIEILTIRVSGYGEAEILHKRFPQGELPIAVRLLEGTKGKLGVVRRGDSAETLDSV